MKIQTPTEVRENGSATILFMALLAIMLILVTAEMRALAQLQNEERYLEKQQIKRFTQPATNAVAVVVSESK